jgi:hypothetical protein
MREYWSFRSNKRQHKAQTLRFGPPEKRGIIQIPAPTVGAIAPLPALRVVS